MFANSLEDERRGLILWFKLNFLHHRGTKKEAFNKFTCFLKQFSAFYYTERRNIHKRKNKCQNIFLMPKSNIRLKITCVSSTTSTQITTKIKTI